LWFPLGAMTKQEVREHARRLGLPVADKQESQEICFVGAEGYAAVVERVVGAMPAGDLVNAAGEVVGRHEGVHHFTVGQRRGLGLSAAEPQYVIHVDAEHHRVHVGPKEALLTSEITITDTVWTRGAPQSDELLGVRQRYRESPRPARTGSAPGGVTARLSEDRK